MCMWDDSRNLILKVIQKNISLAGNANLQELKDMRQRLFVIENDFARGETADETIFPVLDTLMCEACKEFSKSLVQLSNPQDASDFQKSMNDVSNSFDTIESNHRAASEDMKKPRERPVMGMGLHDDNPMRFDIEEALAMVGLDVLINSIVNTWGETVAVFTGEPTATYAAAVQEAKANYLTPLTGDKDIVIANTFAKANEANIGVAIAYPALKQSGGDVVLITNSPDGQVTHYLMGNFGRMTTTPLRIVTEIPPFVNHLIVYSEYPDIAGMGYIGESGRVLYMDNWDDVLRTLQQFHRDEVKVAVYPSSEIQYCA